MSFQSPQALLVQYGSQVRAVAQEVQSLRSRGFSREELFGLGVQGMLESARRYDPALGTQFWSFAYPRVRGAMIDAVRQWTPMRHALHRQLSGAEAALRASIVGSHAHQAAQRRMAEATQALGRVSPEVLAIAWGETSGVEDGLDRPSVPDAYEADELGAEVQDDDGSSRVMRVDALCAYEALETHHLHAALHAAMAQLTLQERMILRGLYFEGRGLVFEELGWSKSWSSRIHTRALRRLRQMLASEWAVERAEPKCALVDEPSVDEQGAEPEREAA